MTTSTTTRLEAVNLILVALGEAPVNSLTGNATGTVAAVQTLLEGTSKEMQTEGWRFNFEADVTWTPDVNGHISVPLDVIRFTPSQQGSLTDEIVARDGFVYNLTKHTNVWTAQQRFDVLYFLDFDKLPEAARNYVAMRAARKAIDIYQGTAEKHGYGAQDEAQARARLGQEESATGRYNMLKDNWSCARIVNRIYPRLWR